MNCMYDYHASAEPATPNEFSVELVDRLVKIARSCKPIIEPARDDAGRAWYMFWTTRERVIDSLPVGWMYRAVIFGGGTTCAFEPCRIEELDQKTSRDGTCYYTD